MHERFRLWCRDLAQRAGLSRVSPPVLGAIAVTCVLAVALGAWRWWPREPARVSAVTVDSAPGVGGSTQASSTAQGAGGIVVHAIGQVMRPGVYQLPSGSRVTDVIDAAGGALGCAALEAVNLARLLEDGEQVAVPSRDEVDRAQAAGGGGSGAAPGVTGAGSGSSAGGVLVDLNSADATALDGLPGVGPATAAKIVADREQNGPFASVDDLGRVSGIGPKKLEALADLVRVR